MAEVIWPQNLIDHMLEIPDPECRQILDKVTRLEAFPEMYPVRTSGPFRGHRWFIAGPWLVYYRVVGDKVYMRAICPRVFPSLLQTSDARKAGLLPKKPPRK